MYLSNPGLPTRHFAVLRGWIRCKFIVLCGRPMLCSSRSALRHLLCSKPRQGGSLVAEIEVLGFVWHKIGVLVGHLWLEFACVDNTFLTDECHDLRLNFLRIERTSSTRRSSSSTSESTTMFESEENHSTRVAAGIASSMNLTTSSSYPSPKMEVRDASRIQSYRLVSEITPVTSPEPSGVPSPSQETPPSTPSEEEIIPQSK